MYPNLNGVGQLMGICYANFGVAATFSSFILDVGGSRDCCVLSRSVYGEGVVDVLLLFFLCILSSTTKQYVSIFI